VLRAGCAGIDRADLGPLIAPGRPRRFQRQESAAPYRRRGRRSARADGDLSRAALVCGSTTPSPRRPAIVTKTSTACGAAARLEAEQRGLDNGIPKKLLDRGRSRLKNVIPARPNCSRFAPTGDRTEGAVARARHAVKRRSPVLRRRRRRRNQEIRWWKRSDRVASSMTSTWADVRLTRWSATAPGSTQRRNTSRPRAGQARSPKPNYRSFR